jgi:hypothetical protein
MQHSKHAQLLKEKCGMSDDVLRWETLVTATGNCRTTIWLSVPSTNGEIARQLSKGSQQSKSEQLTLLRHCAVLSCFLSLLKIQNMLSCKPQALSSLCGFTSVEWLCLLLPHDAPKQNIPASTSIAAHTTQPEGTLPSVL